MTMNTIEMHAGVCIWDNPDLNRVVRPDYGVKTVPLSNKPPMPVPPEYFDGNLTWTSPDKKSMWKWNQNRNEWVCVMEISNDRGRGV